MKNWISCAALAFSLAAFFACKKPVEDSAPSPEGPTCILEKVEAFKIQEGLCANANVTRFDTQIGQVYMFSGMDCIADGGSPIYDGGCKLLCELGTIAGVTKCEVGSTALVLENPLVIWKK